MSETGNILLDTTIVVLHFRRDSSVTAKLRQASVLYLPLPALGELFYGAHHSTFRSKTLAQVQEFLKAVVVLVPGEATANLYGRSKRNWHEQERQYQRMTFG